MKRIILIFTILCVSQLYGMEPEPVLGELPEDVHNTIIRMALATSDTLEEAIKAIKVASVLRGIRYDNLKSFTKLVHMLANKFPKKDTKTIAKLFGTSIAEEYINLGNALIGAISWWEDIDQITKLIMQGADVNYSDKNLGTPFTMANKADNSKEIIQLLKEAVTNKKE
jgi:hypothetical protein